MISSEEISNMLEDYTNTEEYQREIASQYKERVKVFPIQDVVDACAALGIRMEEGEVSIARAGNVNATYITNEYVLKINEDRKDNTYLANRIVSQALGPSSNGVQVVAYDSFEKTPFEILIMKRTPGTTLLDDMLDLTPDDQQALFEEVLELVNQLHSIRFEDFGWISLEGKESFPTYSEFLRHDVSKNIQTIKDKRLCEAGDIEVIERYIMKHIDIFDDEQSVFVHTDLHMGNILHDGRHLKAVIDFDSAQKAPKARTLISLLGLIDNPQQFVEGTDDFPKYKGKDFYNLLPILKSELSDVFADPLLIQKLNIIGLCEGLMWVAGDWSAGFNEQMIASMIREETPESEGELSLTYHGKILSRLT